MPEGPDYLPEYVLAWAEEHRELLDLVVSELLRTDAWPTTTKLTRDLARQGRPVHLDSVLRDMPKPLGFVENHPGRIVLLLFGLRLTSEGHRLLDGFVAFLRVAWERYSGNNEPPVVTRADLSGDHAQVLSEIILREAPFLGGLSTGGPEDDWSREVTPLIVPYWEVQTPDDYLRIRATELAMSPQYGFSSVTVPTSEGPKPAGSPDERDVFISHASEDKEAIARPLSEELMRRGYTVWFDEHELVLGDSLRERIEQGLAHSAIGVVILSHAFFAKRWPQQELNGLYARLVSGESNVIVPVWHGLTQEEVIGYAPTLADLLAGDSADGVEKLADEVARALIRRRQEPRGFPSPAARRAPTSGSIAPMRRPPLGAVNFDLDTAALNIAALELVRDDDPIALQHLFNDALARARHAIEHDEIDVELARLLDKLVCLAATFLMAGQSQWFNVVVGVLTRIYSMPGNDRENDSFLYLTQIDPQAASPRVWLQVLERVYALGALAVRHDKWEAVRELTIQRPKGVGDYERTWLPHALVMASRAGHLRERKGDQVIEVSLLALARSELARLDCLRPDGLDPDSDELLTGAAQFDLLSNLVAMDGTRTGGERRAYPNFARFYQHRVMPIVERLLEDQEMRRILFTGADDQLALALQILGEQARRVGWQTDGFEGWERTPVAAFIAGNLPDGA